MLMENGPNADFEVIFYNGAKFTHSSEGTRIIERNGTTQMVQTEAGVQHLAPETRTLWDYVNKVC